MISCKPGSHTLVLPGTEVGATMRTAITLSHTASVLRPEGHTRRPAHSKTRHLQIARAYSQQTDPREGHGAKSPEEQPVEEPPQAPTQQKPRNPYKGFSSIEDVGDDTLVTGDYADKAEERWREQVQAAKQKGEAGQPAERDKEASSSYGSIEEVGDNRLVSGSYGEDMEKRWQKGEQKGQQRKGEQQKGSEDK